MFDIDSIDTQNQSATATACEQASLYGATPERDEFDPRDIWDRDDAMEAVSEAFRILGTGVGPDGTQLADEREGLLWGFVNMLDAQARRLDRATDRLTPELHDLQTSQDGSEIKSRELELVTDRAQNFGDRRDAFEQLRDLAADAYRTETGDTWRPGRGSHVSQTGKLTSAAIDARDFLRARKDREARAHLPEGTLVAVAGGKTVTDAGAVIARLDKARPSTPISSSSTAAAPASSASPPSGPNATASTRWCASPTGTLTDGPLPSGATTNCSTSCPRASSPSPAPASPTTSSTKQSSSASRFTGSRHDPHRLHGPRRFGGAVPPFLPAPPSTTPPASAFARASPAAPRSAAAPPFFFRTMSHTRRDSIASTRRFASRFAHRSSHFVRRRHLRQRASLQSHSASPN